MILELKTSVEENKAQELAQLMKAFCVRHNGKYVLVTSSSLK